MARILVAFLIAAFTVVPSFAQQPNNPTRASMTLNGLDGPPFPINPVNFQRGTSQTLQLLGTPNSLFVVGGSNGVRSIGVPYQSAGLIDLDQINFQIVFNGVTNPAYTLDGNGVFTVACPISGTTPLNQTRTFQALVQDFTSPSGSTLTAASRTVIVPGITTQSFVLADDGFANFSFASFGFTIPYYANNYTNIWVNANGSLGFNTGNGDFAPSTAAFLQQEPRIAGFWTDLNPAVAGTITMSVDQTTPVPFLRCDFLNVAEFASASPHTVSMTIYSQIGDIILNISGYNAQPLIALVIGISAGGNLGPQGPRDLSALGFNPGLQGIANENFHEFFNAGVGFDLAGRVLTFYATNAGQSGGRYRATCIP